MRFFFYRECHPPGLSLLHPSSGTTGVRNLNLLGQIYSLGPSGVVFCMRAGGKIPPSWHSVRLNFYREFRPPVRRSCLPHWYATKDICLSLWEQTSSFGPSRVVYRVGIDSKFSSFLVLLGKACFYREFRPPSLHSCLLYRYTTRAHSLTS